MPKVLNVNLAKYAIKKDEEDYKTSAFEEISKIFLDVYS